jgi:hypothetical protein
MSNWSRQTVNLDAQFVEDARERWEKMGFRSFTDYVETLMRADMAERPVLIRTEDGMVLASVLRPATPQEIKQAKEKAVPTAKMKPLPVRPQPEAQKKKTEGESGKSAA